MAELARRAPTVPRAAATLLVVRDDPLEVLMLRRRAHGTFPSALVFPGGVVEPEDATWHAHTSVDMSSVDRGFRVAAVRETWEEAGILVAHGIMARLKAGGSFSDAAAGGTLHLDELVDFAHWITPSIEPRRFDTRFFITAAPVGQTAVFDGTETVDTQWIEPTRALELHDSGEQPLVFPTRLNVMRLADSRDVASALHAAAERPRFTVEPNALMRDDGVLVTIPVEAGYRETATFMPR